MQSRIKLTILTLAVCICSNTTINILNHRFHAKLLIIILKKPKIRAQANTSNKNRYILKPKQGQSIFLMQAINSKNDPIKTGAWSLSKADVLNQVFKFNLMPWNYWPKRFAKIRHFSTRTHIPFRAAIKPHMTFNCVVFGTFHLSLFVASFSRWMVSYQFFFRFLLLQ